MRFPNTGIRDSLLDHPWPEVTTFNLGRDYLAVLAQVMDTAPGKP